MPKKPDQTVALSEEMLGVLESQRQLGGDAYPPTLRRLSELCGGAPSEEDILKAAKKQAFTKKAVVTEKVGRNPSLDSPVYFKEDAPAKKTKPKREPAGRKSDGGIAELSTRMLLVLEAQRRLGGPAYPPTLRRLAELCDRNGSDSLVPKATSHEPMSGRTIAAATVKGGKPSLDAPIILKEDVEDGASAILPELLRFALSPVKNQIKGEEAETHAFTLEESKKRLVPALQKMFGEAVERGVNRRDLLQDVAWVRIKGKPLLFLSENMESGRPRRISPAAGHMDQLSPSHDGVSVAMPPPTRDFADAFREAFERLDRRNGSTNFVKLFDLRRALPEFGGEVFDAGLRKLRIDGVFSLDSHEGLHGSLSPDEREAGVREGGSLLVYASRR